MTTSWEATSNKWSEALYSDERTEAATIGDGTNNFTTTSAIWRWRRVGPLHIGELDLVWTGKGSASGNIQVSVPADFYPSAASNCFVHSYQNATGLVYIPSLPQVRLTGGHMIFVTYAADGSGGTQLNDTAFTATGTINMKFIADAAQ